MTQLPTGSEKVFPQRGDLKNVGSGKVGSQEIEKVTINGKYPIAGGVSGKKIKNKININVGGFL